MKSNFERLLSAKGMDMPIEVIECFHALLIDVMQNEDINVLIGNVSKMINQVDLVGIINPHSIIHAI